MPSGLIESIWKEASLIVAVFVVILYAGHRGWWYWSPGVRALTEEIAHDRDNWKTLACALLRKQGIDIPADFEKPHSPLKESKDR